MVVEDGLEYACMYVDRIFPSVSDDRFALEVNDEGDSMDQSKTDGMVVLKKKADSSLSSREVFPWILQTPLRAKQQV